MQRHPHVTAFLIFLGLTVVAGWPILTRLDQVIIGQDPDVHINPWADWWTLKALGDPELSIWYTDYLFYPQGVSLAFHSFSHLTTAISLLLSRFVGTLPGYNLTILLYYPLNALAMFHLARYLTRSDVAAILAGIVFAFNSHSLYQSCHPVLAVIFVFPWTTLFFLRAVFEGRPRYVLFAALFVFITALSSMILLIMMALWIGLLIAALLLSGRWPKRAWCTVTLFAFLSAIASLPAALPLLASAGGGDNSFLAQPLNSISLNMLTPFYPTWVVWDQRSIYLGIIPFFLFLLSIRPHRARPWLLLLLTVYLLAIGPNPTFLNYRTDLILPWAVVPSLLVRNMYRLNILIGLCLGVLVAYGWLVFAKEKLHKPWIYRLVALLFALLIFADYLAPGFPYTPVKVSAFYTDFLADVPDDVALAIVPFGRQEDKEYLYYQTLHQHRMVGGVVSRSEQATPDLVLSNPLLRAGAVDLSPTALPEDVTPSLRALSTYNIGFLVIHRDDKLDVEAWREAIPYAPVFDDEQLLAYRIPGELSPPWP